MPRDAETAWGRIRAKRQMPATNNNPSVIAYLTAVLEANGMKSTAARDVKTAMRLVSDIQPALICLDITLPPETGVSFHVRMRQKEELENILVVMVSGILVADEFDFRSYAKEMSFPAAENWTENSIDVEKYLRRIEVCWCSGNWHLRLIEYGKKSGGKYTHRHLHREGISHN